MVMWSEKSNAMIKILTVTMGVLVSVKQKKDGLAKLQIIRRKQLLIVKLHVGMVSK